MSPLCVTYCLSFYVYSHSLRSSVACLLNVAQIATAEMGNAAFIAFASRIWRSDVPDRQLPWNSFMKHLIVLFRVGFFFLFFFSHLFLRWGCCLLTKCLDFYCSIWVYFIRHFIALNFIIIIFLKAFLTQNQSHIKMASQYLKWSKQLQPATLAVHLSTIKALANFRALVYLQQM